MGIFDTFFYKPIFNFLVFIYESLPFADLGIAIIVLTLIIRLILYPLSIKSVKAQKVLKEIQPKIQEVQQKYKTNKQKQTEEMLKIYKSTGAGPFLGIFLPLVQLPVLFALYRVFLKGLQPEELTKLYAFIPNPGTLNTYFLGLIDLSQTNLVLAFLAGGLQFFQAKQMSPKTKGQKVPGPLAVFQKQMIYFFPVVTVVFISQLPSALSLYLIITFLFSLFEWYIVKNKK